jgi:hypothetical protein
MNTELSQAVWLAWVTHGEQMDESSEPYLAHVARVAARVAAGGSKLQTVAWLHAVLTDSKLELTDLPQYGFGAPVIEAVDAVSRRYYEPDSAYLNRMSANPLARMVMRADIAVNDDPARLKTFNDETRVVRTTKYALMRAVLGEACNVSPDAFIAFGAADLEWVGLWENDPIQLYETYPLKIAGEAVRLVLLACLDEAIITPVLRGSLPRGCELVGLNHRVKSPNATAARLERSTEEIGHLEDPKDMLRFTVVVDESSMWADTFDLCAILAERLTPLRARSFFVEGNCYYGIHTWWKGTTGLFVELQIHTRTSYRIKDETHELYETYRSPQRVLSERYASWRALVTAWSDHPIPVGCPLTLGGIALEHRRHPPPDGDLVAVRSVRLED